MRANSESDLSNTPIIEAMRNHEKFRDFAVPVDSEHFPQIHDAEFFLLDNGLVVNAEGWHHPDGKLVGEVLYAPDSRGNKQVFGNPYRKVTLYLDTFTPVPYAERGGLLETYDPTLNQTDTNPYYAKYKQIVPRDSIIAHLPPDHVFHQIVDKTAGTDSSVAKDVQDVERLLGLDLTGIEFGLTGGLSLGNYENFHDIDLVFKGSLQENLQIAHAMRNLVVRDPHRRIIEGGKGWNIRFHNDRNTFMCNFFSYQKPEDAPLKEFEMDVIFPNVSVVGKVSDDTHTMYTPSIFSLSNASLFALDKDNNEERFASDEIPVIVYHTATRGECFYRDIVYAQGAYVHINTPDDDYDAVCVIEREGVRNLTPSWNGYYEE